MLNNRLDLYTTVTLNSNLELDYLSSNLETYVPTVSRQLYTVLQHEVGRMDLISFKLYGTPYFWDLIARVNNIIDPENDLSNGQQIIIPSLTDYYNFYNLNAKLPATTTFTSSSGFYTLT